jgi:hypothetical protein
MTQTSTDSKNHRTGGITFLSIVNAFALGITVLFWGMVFFRRLVPFPGDLTSMADRASSAVTYGFMIGDILYSVPLLLLAWLGLWKLKSWGWLAAQMANALWIYSMTVILLRDAYTNYRRAVCCSFRFPPLLFGQFRIYGYIEKILELWNNDSC